MLPDALRSIRGPLLGSLAALTGCSTMPPPSMPAHVDYDFDARFVASADGEVTLPVTQRDLVISRLQLSPRPAAERFGPGVRVLRYAPGAVVRVQGRLRAYRDADGSLPSLQELLPGAAEVR